VAIDEMPVRDGVMSDCVVHGERLAIVGTPAALSKPLWALAVIPIRYIKAKVISSAAWI
jgi:hypothetical protein